MVFAVCAVPIVSNRAATLPNTKASALKYKASVLVDRSSEVQASAQ
jgi:hypothetical protein